MAFPSSPFLLLALSLSILLIISPAESQTCKSQKFSSNKIFPNCSDLPVLSAHLHWTYNATNSSLSVAFTAPPAKSDGWVAWAINPTGTGMAGAQAFVAVRHSNGSISLQTYNITSYSMLMPAKLSFAVWDESTEYADGKITIFASAKVPEKAESLNFIWQVGPGINQTTGFLLKHEFKPDNLNAKAQLNLVSGTTVIAPSGSPAASPSPAGSTNGSSNAPAPGKNGAVSLFASRESFGFSIASLLVVFVNLVVAL